MTDAEIARLWSRIHKTDGCWLWQGTLRPDGYPVFTYRGGQVRVHRFTYEAMVGPIPTGHHLHHWCDTPRCVNPAHLEAMTAQEHKRLDNSNARKEVCPNGHPYDYRWRRKRYCRTCRADYMRRYEQTNPRRGR